MPSIEELANAQRQHESTIAEKRAKEEAQVVEERTKVERIAKNKERAPKDYEARETAIEGLNLSRQELDTLKASKIDERIQNAEQLKQGEAAKARELEERQAEFAEIQEHLQAIEQLVVGKALSKIAPEVQTALAHTQQESLRAKQLTQEVLGALEKIKSDQVSVSQIEDYKALQARIEALRVEVMVLEENPFVIDRLFEEATTENEIRDSVVNRVGYAVRDGARRDFDKMLAQTFLTEEFAARGFDKITDPEKRKKSMQGLAQSLYVTAGGEADETSQNHHNLDSDEKLGVVLKNLTGRYGHAHGTVGMFKGAGGTAFTKDLIGRHLGSLNLIRSYSLGAGRYSEEITTRRFDQNEWNSLASDVSQYGFTTNENGAILPKNADPATRESIETAFEAKKAEAEKIAEKLAAEEKEEIGREILRLTTRIEKTQLALAESETARATLKPLSQGTFGERNYSSEREKILGEINRAEGLIPGLKFEQERLGFFAFGKKAEIAEKLKNLPLLVASKQEELATLEKNRKAYDDANTTLRRVGEAHKIASDMQGLNSELQRMNARLKALG